MKVNTVAIGPVVDSPSWNWVGFDTARELSKYFSLKTLKKVIPPCDVAIVVKKLLADSDTTAAAKLLYLPIDRYPSAEDIHGDREFLRTCSAVGCHSECLIPYVAAYCDKVIFIEHHGRYTLPQIKPYDPEGYVIWIGGFQHIPFLIKWLDCHPIHRPLKLLTNFGNPSARRVADELAHSLEVSVTIKDGRLGGYPVYLWSERAQYQMMCDAAAALDIKAGAWLGRFHWKQYMKPPTKGQKYVSSGIPFATNDDSYCFDYFRRRGFLLATPDQEERWFSREYWTDTVRYATSLRQTISLESMGLRYKCLIEEIISYPDDRWPVENAVATADQSNGKL